MNKPKVPLRMCVACQAMKPKRELLRIVKTPEGEIELDFTGKKNGRGVYICKDKACFDKLPKSEKKIRKSFGTSLPEDVTARIREEFDKSEP